MSDRVPIWIVEPERTQRRRAAARKLLDGAPKEDKFPETATLGRLKEELKRTRQHSRDNIHSLVIELQTTLKQRYPGARVAFAATSADAVEHITEISGIRRMVSTNNSSVVTQELNPGLTSKGFTVINSYFHEFSAYEKNFQDYWDLPGLADNDLFGSFDTTMRFAGLPEGETRKYLAVLGVNAIAAEDGTAFFLEHFSNIAKDLGTAEKVVLVVGLDKIVKTRQEALHQTQCMGMFGLESILLGIEPRPDDTAAIDDLPLLPAGAERELHIIILDNGRSKLVEGKFRDLFLCIGCRACNKHCPIRHSFTKADYLWTPKNYLRKFLYGDGKSVDACLHCEACRVECPVDIDLPYLMWQAKLDFLVEHRTPFQDRLLGRPELLARLGTRVAPVANWMMRRRAIRVPMEAVSGIDRRTSLPTFHSRTFRERIKCGLDDRDVWRGPNRCVSSRLGGDFHNDLAT